MNLPKLLIVDDAFTILSLIESMCKNEYEVLKCRSVVDAKEKLESNIPDIIITDLNMPDESGEMLVNYLKNDPRFSGIPLIVLSGSDDLETKLRMLKTGVDDFVQKPFNLEELSLRTNNILRRYNAKNKFVI